MKVNELSGVTIEVKAVKMKEDHYEYVIIG